MSDAPKPLAGLDAELHDALAECGRIIEAIPWDERRQVVDRFVAGEFGLDGRARDFVVGVMIVAHQRRMFDEEWNQTRAIPPAEEDVIVLTPRTLALVCPEGHELAVPDNWREIWGTDTVRCTIHDTVMVEEAR